MVQLPVLLRVTLAEETPLPSIDGVPTEHDPVALKAICKSVATPAVVWAVAVTVTGVAEIRYELCKVPRTIFWLSVRMAGGEGTLVRCVLVFWSGTSVVVIV